MAEQIAPGAMVECSDYPLGAVERVEGDGALVVRPARADYLLKIPRDLVASASPGRVTLRVTLQDVEQYAVGDRAGAQPSRNVAAPAADPAPRAEEVLGSPPGEPPTSPATG